MLSSVSSAVAQLTQLPAAPEELSRAAGSQPRPARAQAALAPLVAASASRATPKARAAPRRAAAGYAQATSSSGRARSTSTTKKKAGPLDFLDDPKLPVEEKLLRLLAYLNDKWNKDLDKKMKELKQEGAAGSSGGTKAPGSKSSGGGVSGFLKKAVGIAGKAIPQLGVTLEALGNPTVRAVVSKLAGPALAAFATAMGQPELAPVALKYGPEIVDTLAGAASSLSADGGAAPLGLVTGGAGTSAGAAASKSAGSSGTKDTATDLGSDRNAQLKLMELQRILDQQKEMFSLVSNLLRTTHETRMALIQNVR